MLNRLQLKFPYEEILHGKNYIKQKFVCCENEVRIKKSVTCCWVVLFTLTFQSTVLVVQVFWRIIFLCSHLKLLVLSEFALCQNHVFSYLMRNIPKFSIIKRIIFTCYLEANIMRQLLSTLQVCILCSSQKWCQIWD